jgi:endonuclease/exonuclease/phosphatase family metal-dependent hydrolase
MFFIDVFMFLKEIDVYLCHLYPMKKILSLSLAIVLSFPLLGRDTTLVMFWNLENFFNYHDNGGGEADTEFSSFGSRHWTKKRFYAKCNAIAKTVLWVGSSRGRLPDVIGFAEVEDRFVLNRLVYGTALKKFDYGIVHYDSPDPRGIDVALLYRKAVFNVVSSNRCPVVNPDSTGSPLQTRDILAVRLMRVRASDTASIAFVVNHHPSKYGGGESDWRREAAISKLRAVCDSLCGAGINSIVAMGDFNDTPENGLFGGLSPALANLASPLARKGIGSIKFNGKWELIDMFFVSQGLVPFSVMEVLKVPFLMVRDKSHSGEKPLRTFSGPRYMGGVSDHCPVLLVISR